MSDVLMDLHFHYKAVKARLNAGVSKFAAEPEPVPEPVPEPITPLDHLKPVPRFDLMRGLLASDETKYRILPILERNRITWKDACSRHREARYIRIRCEIYVVLKAHGWSLPQIGRLVGKRDHTTVLHSIRRFVAAKVTETQLQMCRDLEMDPVRYLYGKMQLEEMRMELNERK
ncbi:Chromosomal replication initiator, DnaA C-terminal [uncultured Caudovirales phage]|uniref:Chromosomal replication initiator, DnaA C-terminal n=1 Tax=uncultured Caudovirales phage TaxID=2100421 RepID=A0A6J5L7F8_9CAUD|nr:Chromosomal replication initiator, DnaA C-terminal [uncultured Caudovirales phage]